MEKSTIQGMAEHLFCTKSLWKTMLTNWTQSNTIIKWNLNEPEEFEEKPFVMLSAMSGNVGSGLCWHNNNLLHGQFNSLAPGRYGSNLEYFQ